MGAVSGAWEGGLGPDPLTNELEGGANEPARECGSNGVLRDLSYGVG